jgi:hypothetical protein
MADRIAFLDALLAGLGWSHKVKRGGALELGGAS